MSNERFKKLNINREKILEWIIQYANENFNDYSISDLTKVNNNQFRCIITTDKEIMIDFYFNNDGTTTINPRVGKNQDLSFDIASYLLTKVNTNDTRGRSFSVHHFKDDYFNLLKEYLIDELGVELIENRYNENNRYTLYKFKSKYGDTLTLLYYDNETLLVQGKPLYLYQEVICFIAQFISFENVVKKQSEFLETNIDPLEVKKEITNRLPTSINFFDEIHTKILSSSISLKNSNIVLEDYSCFAFPVLRVLEAYLKKLFAVYNINVGKNGFNMFKKDDYGYYVLNDDTKKIIADKDMQAVIEQCYNLYNQKRHGLFHAQAHGFRTVIIEKKEDAINIITEVLDVIESTYASVKHIIYR